MFSKEELRERKAAFWESYKRYMGNRKTLAGKKANWLNYRTGIKFMFVRLEATSKYASFCIDIQPKEEGIREIFYEQFTELKKVFEEEMGTDGVWHEDYHIDYRTTISRIEYKLEGVNMFKESDRDRIFGFFKERSIAFDAFWCNYDEILLTLVQ